MVLIQQNHSATTKHKHENLEMIEFKHSSMVHGVYQHPNKMTRPKNNSNDMALAMFTHQTINSIPHGMEITVRVLVSKTTATTIIMLAL